MIVVISIHFPRKLEKQGEQSHCTIDNTSIFFTSLAIATRPFCCQYNRLSFAKITPIHTYADLELDLIGTGGEILNVTDPPETISFKPNWLKMT